jgi:hypothetical protein
VLAVALGSCIGIDAHPVNSGAQADPCDIEPVSINAGAERVPSPDRTLPASLPSIPDTTLVMHCGTPDGPPTLIAVVALSVRPHAPRAPPRG